MILKFQPNLRLLVLLCALLGSTITWSQGIISPKNIKNIRVQSLSDAEIEKIRGEMSKQNISIDQLETMAISNGMSPTDFSVLKARIENKSPSVAPSAVEKGTNLTEETH